MQMQDFIKIAGNGRKTARDMTYDEAAAAMTLIMEGQATEGQLAAFMAVLRIKEESSDELAAFAAVMRRYCHTVKVERARLVDVCLPYDGRSKAFSLTPAAACIAAAGGAAVALHGRLGAITPPKFGLGVGDTLAALGLSATATSAQAAHLLENPQVGLAFVATEQFAPRLEAFNQVRNDYGLRSFFNSIEKLLNPFGAEIGIAGVFHGPVLAKIANVLAGQGYRRGLAVHGPEGSIDVLTSRATRLVELEIPNPAQSWTIDPADFGWRTHPQAEPSGYAAPNQPANTTHDIEGEAALPALSAKENAELTEQILRNTTSHDPAWESTQRGAILSAALLLYAAGQSEDYKGAVDLAEQILKSGAALARLENWRRATTSINYLAGWQPPMAKFTQLVPQGGLLRGY